VTTAVGVGEYGTQQAARHDEIGQAVIDFSEALGRPGEVVAYDCDIKEQATDFFGGKVFLSLCFRIPRLV
jgi:hypothetical protein